MHKKIEIFPIYVKGQIKSNSNIVDVLLDSIKGDYNKHNNNDNISIENKDIIVIAQKIVSKAEGRLINMNKVNPSQNAIDLSNQVDKDPKFVEMILQESRKIVRIFNNTIIAETHHGFICANAGIDQSNVSSKKNQVLLLPINPDRSAELIRKQIYEKIRKKVSVIITDTFGRPFRIGQTNIAIGIAGIKPLRSYRGKQDMFGKILMVTEIAIVDEIASAAELVMGKTASIPIAIVRNVNYSMHCNCTIRKIIRKEKKDIFR
jgi:coenzyme F420-0:L-glutamate ligase / coenzyme F420-1:gamma-L-glutamate ligase